MLSNAQQCHAFNSELTLMGELHTSPTFATHSGLSLSFEGSLADARMTWSLAFQPHCLSETASWHCDVAGACDSRLHVNCVLLYQSATVKNESASVLPDA